MKSVFAGASVMLGILLYDIFYCRRPLIQGNYFSKIKPREANFTLDELQNMVTTGDFNTIMKKII